MNRLRRWWESLKRYMRDYRFHSLFVRYLAASILVVTLPVYAINRAYSARMLASAAQQMQRMNDLELSRSQNAVESMLALLKNMAYVTSQQRDVLRLAAYERLPEQFYENQFSELKKSVVGYMRVTRCIDSVYIYFEKPGGVLSFETEEKTAYLPVSKLTDREWLARYNRLQERAFDVHARYKAGNWPFLITIMYPIENDAGARRGAVALNVDVRVLANSLGTGSYRRDGEPVLAAFSQADRSLFYADEYRLFENERPAADELAALWTDDFVPGEYRLWGQRCLISSAPSSSGLLRYFYLTTLDRFGALRSDAAGFFRWMIAASLAVELIVSLFLAARAYQPIHALMQAAEEPAESMLPGEQRRQNEIAYLKTYIAAKQEQTARMREEIDLRVACLQNAQMTALQSQINPHFLYNTLEAIGDKVVMLVGRENEGSEMICELSELLRISLATDSYVVPLREELTHVRLYMNLIDFRYGGSVQWNLDVPEELLDRRVVKLSLQPLIENSIEHGLRPKRRQGSIRIAARAEGQGFVIQVSDDGVGMPQEEIDRLNERFHTQAPQQAQHIGLQNVNQRIRLIYGDRSGLFLSQRPEGGLCIEVRYAE